MFPCGARYGGAGKMAGNPVFSGVGGVAEKWCPGIPAPRDRPQRRSLGCGRKRHTNSIHACFEPIIIFSILFTKLMPFGVISSIRLRRSRTGVLAMTSLCPIKV